MTDKIDNEYENSLYSWMTSIFDVKVWFMEQFQVKLSWSEFFEMLNLAKDLREDKKNFDFEFRTQRKGDG